MKFEVEACGGIYISTDEAVRDDKIITGKTWQSQPEFYQIVFKCLNEVEEVQHQQSKRTAATLTA